MTVQVHVTKFERNTRTGQWRGLCSTCLWCRVGTREEVQALAATHDLEWVDADPRSEPPTVAAGIGESP